MAPRIRPMGPEDLPQVGALGALLVGFHHGLDPRRFIPSTPATAGGYASFFATQLGKPHVVLLVAEGDSRIVGYAYGGVEGTDYMALRGPAGVAYDLLVDPSHRGQGTGRRLLDALIGALRSRGAPRIVLHVADQNAAAQRLFSATGFRRTMVEMTLDGADGSTP